MIFSAHYNLLLKNYYARLLMVLVTWLWSLVAWPKNLFLDMQQFEAHFLISCAQKINPSLWSFLFLIFYEKFLSSSQLTMLERETTVVETQAETWSQLALALKIPLAWNNDLLDVLRKFHILGKHMKCVLSLNI